MQRLRPCRVLSPSAAAAAVAYNADDDAVFGPSHVDHGMLCRRDAGKLRVAARWDMPVKDGIGLAAEIRHTRRSRPVDWHNYVSISLSSP